MQTGQVALGLPSAAGFEAITRQLADWAVPVDLSQLRDAYYHSRVLSPNQYSGLIRLLEIFAQQLSLTANQIFRDRATSRTKGMARNLSARRSAPEGRAAGAMRLAA